MSSPSQSLSRSAHRWKTIVLVFSIFTLALATLPSISASPAEAGVRRPLRQINKPVVIFDTDMGPDIDDALALGMVHSYADAGFWKIGAVTLSRQSPTGRGVKYIDAVNTYYGRPHIPIGNHKGGHPEDDAGTFDHLVTNSPWADRYDYDIKPQSVRHGHKVIRDVLEQSRNGQVVIISTGFPSNLSALLNSPGGKDLVRRKVSRLVWAGGEYSGFNGQTENEYNLNHWSIHTPTVNHSFNVLRNWPGQILQLEYSLGYKVLFPSSAMRALPTNHILRRTYFYRDAKTFFWHEPDGLGSFNTRSWDLLAVLAAAGNVGNHFPAVTKKSNRGTITAVRSSTGGVKTTFRAHPGGNHLRVGLAAADYGLTQDGPGNAVTQKLKNKLVRVVSRPVR